MCHGEPHLTLQRLGPVLLDHNAQLKHQLWGTLKEGLQEPEHVDVGVLEHHGPVEAPVILLPPPTLDAQVHGADIPV